MTTRCANGIRLLQSQNYRYLRTISVYFKFHQFKTSRRGTMIQRSRKRIALVGDAGIKRENNFPLLLSFCSQPDWRTKITQCNYAWIAGFITQTVGQSKITQAEIGKLMDQSGGFVSG